MLNILVTGGAGYIGSHCCKQLYLQGHNPITIDNLVYGHPQAVKWGPLEEGDISDRERLETVMHKYRPEAVMHFAALSLVGESMETPLAYFDNNVGGTIKLLESVREHGVPRFVFSSSAAVYGSPDSLPIVETAACVPENPYGMTKLMVERVLESSRDAFGLSYVALRYFNAGGSTARCGEDHDPETHLIPVVLDVALGRRERFTIFGDDYDTPDGTCIRDYVHVDDLVDAHVLALDALAAGDVRAYNVGIGRGHSVREVIDACRRVSGVDFPGAEGARRAGDPPVLYADPALITRELGWRPRYVELDAIVETAWRWRRAHPTGY